VSDGLANLDNFCYRHPNRQSWCSASCGRTICAECQTPAAVGVHCPECMRESRQNAPRTRPAVVTSGASARQPGTRRHLFDHGLCVVVFVAEVLTGQLVGSGSPIVDALLYYPPYTSVQPWRMLTSLRARIHPAHPLQHVPLYVLGPELERLVGREGGSLSLFLLSGLGGSVAVFADEAPTRRSSAHPEPSSGSFRCLLRDQLSLSSSLI
jgi:hypothetical protein